jgi:hypothetical protein
MASDGVNAWEARLFPVSANLDVPEEAEDAAKQIELPTAADWAGTTVTAMALNGVKGREPSVGKS